jgi:hypothetical protein
VKISEIGFQGKSVSLLEEPSNVITVVVNMLPGISLTEAGD